jgi:hypothetical protein
MKIQSFIVFVVAAFTNLTSVDGVVNWASPSLKLEILAESHKYAVPYANVTFSKVLHVATTALKNSHMYRPS